MTRTKDRPMTTDATAPTIDAPSPAPRKPPPLATTIVVRLSPKQRRKLEQVRKQNCFDTLSQALRFVVEVHG